MPGALRLCDDLGAAQAVYAIGETVFVSGRGLRPSTPYSFTLADNDRDSPRTLIDRCARNRHSTLQVTALETNDRLIHKHDNLGGAEILRRLRRPCAAPVRLRSARPPATGRRAWNGRYRDLPAQFPRRVRADICGAAPVRLACGRPDRGDNRPNLRPRWRRPDRRARPCQRPSAGQLPIHRQGLSARLACIG